jgi:hypothetical protein
LKLSFERANYKIINQTQKNRIDKFIENHGGLVFHETLFNEILSGFIKSDLYYHFAYRENNLVGICPVHKTQKGLLKKYESGKLDFEIPYGGWVFSNETELPELMSLFKPGPFEAFNYFSNILINNNTILTTDAYIYWTSIINLDTALEEIWKINIDSKRRNMIRKAQKIGIKINICGSEVINDFYSLLKEMNISTGMKSKGIEFYKQLISCYPAEKARIMLAYKDNDLLSGIFLLGNKNVIHYWQGASHWNAGNYGQGELLQWEAIKWSSRMGVQYYDLCYLYSNKQLEEKEKKQMRIADFKLGFSKELMPFYLISKRSYSFKILNKIQNTLRYYRR